MFDLVDILKREDKKAGVAAPVSQNCALYYQTEQCQQLVMEAFRFEGLSEPVDKSFDGADFDQLSEEVEFVFIELTQTEDLISEANRILPLLPAHLSVVIIGSKDMISIIRELKDMGLYYLFWPVTKEDLIHFYRNVAGSRDSEYSIGKKRKSKRAAIVSAKGGLGASLLTAELGSILANERKVSTLLVDHDYAGGNLDIVLGVKQFEKRLLQPGTLLGSIDNTYASGLVKKVGSHLSLLSVCSESFDRPTIGEYIQTITEQLAYDVNVMLEDFGHGIGGEVELEQILTRIDTLVLIMDPTVSAMRDYNRLVTLVRKMDKENQIRLITVMNCTRPKQTNSVNKNDIEKFALAPVDIRIPFDARVNERILTGERIFNSSSSAAKSISLLASMILGEESKYEEGAWAELKRWLRR
ncbi:P-loop NTPase [Vibrio sp. JC009]|uniref:AAA family ATPase n=1 Tax=Vibrio sp. JC009 TaxID=2912314 RepID=UPI0023AEDFD5|nr:P-loop NTPase [Vibrio sp. JC009]WED22299.1 P-loop NTPase [Vibrio sp. JC009]